MSGPRRRALFGRALALALAPGGAALAGCAGTDQTRTDRTGTDQTATTAVAGSQPGPVHEHRADGLPPLRWQRIGPQAVAVLGPTPPPGPETGPPQGNLGLLIGRRASLAVNTGLSARQARALLSLAEALGAPPVRLALVTQPVQEFVMGASALAERGIDVLAHPRACEWIAARCGTCLERLRRTLGDAAMADTRLQVPAPLAVDRLVADPRVADLGLALWQPGWAASPGDVVLRSSTAGVVLAGALGCVDRVPDLRDADPLAWPPAVDALAEDASAWVLPGYGPVSRPAALRAAANYVRALDRAVRQALAAGWSLNEMLQRLELPRWAAVARYDAVHRRNVQRMLLRIESSELDASVPPSG